MATGKSGFSPALQALEKKLRATAQRYPGFAARLKEKSFAAQIKLRDGSEGRCFYFKAGKVTSQAGVHQADVVVSYDSAKLAVRLMRPNPDQLDILHAKKNFQIAVEGPDELTVWFSETLSMMRSAGEQIRRQPGRRRDALYQQYQWRPVLCVRERRQDRAHHAHRVR